MNPEEEKLLQAFEAVLESDDPSPEVTLADGSRFAVERDPAPGIVLRIRALHGARASDFSMVVYAAAPEPPPGYPEELPFVPHADVSIGRSGEDGRVWANWWFATNPSGVVEAVLRQSLSDGWVEEPHDPGLSNLGVRAVELHRGERTRFITATVTSPSGFVSFAEYPATRTS